ncbi:MAG: hypothetical protein JNJ89_14905 [Rubrivivax sp.]|nr:hypothetical protein [Rubrivivax sp.]
MTTSNLRRPRVRWPGLLLWAALGVVADAAARDRVDCKEARCENKDTGGSAQLSTTPAYRSIYQFDLLALSPGCAATKLDAKDKVRLPKDTYFRESLDREAQTVESLVVHIYRVDEEAGGKDATAAKYFSQPYRLCLSGEYAVPRSYYRRVGGFNTGLLVVPFKLRRGDIFSDSTIGPYLSYKWDIVEVLATAGLSQISTVENGSGTDIKSETGLTGAMGVNFQLGKDWDIAFIAGVDRLSGAVGKAWKYQNKPWVSFAIGFNFTR